MPRLAFGGESLISVTKNGELPTVALVFHLKSRRKLSQVKLPIGSPSMGEELWRNPKCDEKERLLTFDQSIYSNEQF